MVWRNISPRRRVSSKRKTMRCLWQTEPLRASVPVNPSRKPSTKPTVNLVEPRDSEDMDDDEPEGTIHTVYAAELGDHKTRKTLQCHIQISRQPIKALIDTGTSINLLTQDMFNTISDRPKLRPKHVQVFAFGNKTRLTLLTKNTWRSVRG